MFLLPFFSYGKKGRRLRGRDRAVLMLQLIFLKQDQDRRFPQRQATPFSSIAKKREEKKLF